MQTYSSFITSLLIILNAFPSSAFAYLYENETAIVKHLKPVTTTEFDSGIPFVDSVYVINLDSRTDKWHRIRDIFAGKGINVNRMSAVEGWLITEEVKKELAGPYPVNLYGAEIGCFLSHLSILKEAYDRGFNLIWVCEDDLEFLEDESQIPLMIENLNNIDPNWDILYTDTNCRNPYDGYYAPWMTNPRPDQTVPPFNYLNRRTPVGHDLQRIRTRFGTTSMLISKRGIKKILDYFSHVYMWCAIDWDLHYIPGIREYAPTRDIITNLRNGFISDIHPGG